MDALKLRKLRDYGRYLPLDFEEYGLSVIWFSYYFSKEDKRKINLQMHHHAFYEAIFVLDGELRYKTEEKKVFSVKKGEFILFPPECEHAQIFKSDDVQKVGIAFSHTPTADTELIFETKPLVKKADEFLSLFDFLADGLLGEKGIYFLRNCVLSAIFMVAKSVVDHSEFSLPNKEEQRVERAKKFILDNCDRDIFLQEVATFLNLSQKQLNRIFVKHKGISVSEFIRSCRIERAKELLKNKDVSISFVAQTLGFSSEYNFNRFFKRFMGITPGVYKKNFH